MSAKLDLRSDGLHLSKIGQMAQNRDPQSDGPQQRQNSGMSRKTRVNFPKTNSTKVNHIKNLTESSVVSYEIDEGYDSSISDREQKLTPSKENKN